MKINFSALQNINARKIIKDAKWVYPRVISASRATDIPAWHSQWLMERLRAGFCYWQNPYNTRQIQAVSFEKVKAIVFWSKNPVPIMRHLQEISDSGKKFYFQFTLNDYPRLEFGLPPLEQRIRIFRELARNYPVIWRYDPIIFQESMTIKWHLEKIENLLGQIGDVTEKLVFSFLDLYPRVRRNLKKFAFDLSAPEPEILLEFAAALAELRDKKAPRLTLAACAETGIDFAKLGIEKNCCIDASLINKICNEKIFQELPGKEAQVNLFANSAIFPNQAKRFEKDKGQRPECHCAPSKDIGSYKLHKCRHGCLYCYAGHF